MLSFIYNITYFKHACLFFCVQPFLNSINFPPKKKKLSKHKTTTNSGKSDIEVFLSWFVMFTINKFINSMSNPSLSKNGKNKLTEEYRADLVSKNQISEFLMKVLFNSNNFYPTVHT